MSMTRDWRVVRRDPYKLVMMRYLPATDEVEMCEEWYEDAPLAQARSERDLPTFQDTNLKPLAVIPDSVMSRAINEGWVNDQDQWAKWAKDIDNNKLVTS